MQLITALKMEKIKLLFSLKFFTISISLFSQKNNEIVYIEFNKSKDNHVSKKGSINYFDICIDNNKYVRFQYGIYNVKTVQEFNFKIMNRIELSEFLKKDNPNKNNRPKDYSAIQSVYQRTPAPELQLSVLKV